MIQKDFFTRVMDKIAALNIPYMITGGVATIFYGKPRVTHDIDLVVEVKEGLISKIEELFREGFYVSDRAIKNAISHKSMFNIIHPETGIKIDFWILQDTKYDRERFNRRKREKIFQKDVYITAPEDAIIKKLLWYKESDIDKHIDDALGILQIQYGRLDYSYIEKWVKELGVGKNWEKIKEEASKL